MEDRVALLEAKIAALEARIVFLEARVFTHEVTPWVLPPVWSIRTDDTNA